MEFIGKAKQLDDIDLPRIGSRIGVGEDEIHAVLEVETRGGGFDGDGRPKMLFEPHIFYRELTGAQRDEAVRQGLAYKRWGAQKYPRESYTRLINAMKINPEAALRSASWGLGQIMGFNCKLAGYETAADMVKAFLDDEETHLEAMVEFIKSTGLADELHRHDWAGFAHGYNGSGYAKHGYHTKLAAAFRKWQSIPDTPFEIDRSDIDHNLAVEDDMQREAPSGGRPTLRVGDHSSAFVMDLQTMLTNNGYSLGRIDGHFGDGTKAAVMDFQARNGLVSDGIVGPMTWDAITKAQPKPERNVSIQDLRDRGSSTIENVDKGKKVIGRIGIPSLALDAIGKVDDASAALAKAEGALGTVQAIAATYWPTLLIIGVGVVAWRMLGGVASSRLSDAITNKNMGR